MLLRLIPWLRCDTSSSASDGQRAITEAGVPEAFPDLTIFVDPRRLRSQSTINKVRGQPVGTVADHGLASPAGCPRLPDCEQFCLVLNGLRSLLRKPGRFSQRPARIARPWQEAAFRDAPMLRGFFADEPHLRDRLLRWCEKILTRE